MCGGTAGPSRLWQMGQIWYHHHLLVNSTYQSIVNISLLFSKVGCLWVCYSSSHWLSRYVELARMQFGKDWQWRRTTVVSTLETAYLLEVPLEIICDITSYFWLGRPYAM